MTVKTLTYIHRLLIENEDKLHKAKELARKARNEAEEKDLDTLPDMEDIYEVTREKWLDAHNARVEFEAREW